MAKKTSWSFRYPNSSAQGFWCLRRCSWSRGIIGRFGRCKLIFWLPLGTSCEISGISVSFRLISFVSLIWRMGTACELGLGMVCGAKPINERGSRCANLQKPSGGRKCCWWTVLGQSVAPRLAKPVSSLCKNLQKIGQNIIKFRAYILPIN